MYHWPMQYNNVLSSFSQRKRGNPGKVIPDGCKEPVEHSQVALAMFSSQMERFRFWSSLRSLHFWNCLPLTFVLWEVTGRARPAPGPGSHSRWETWCFLDAPVRPGHSWPWQLIYQNEFWEDCHQAELYFPKHKTSAWEGKHDFRCEINKVTLLMSCQLIWDVGAMETSCSQNPRSPRPLKLESLKSCSLHFAHFNNNENSKMTFWIYAALVCEVL